MCVCMLCMQNWADSDTLNDDACLCRWLYGILPTCHCFEAPQSPGSPNLNAFKQVTLPMRHKSGSLQMWRSRSRYLYFFIRTCLHTLYGYRLRVLVRHSVFKTTVVKRSLLRETAHSNRRYGVHITVTGTYAVTVATEYICSNRRYGVHMQ
jgi:hypothetical protein